MLLAADYPFLDIFWTMVIFFCWVAWIWLLIAIFSDLFRRHDKSGWGKALWVVFLIIIPFLGVLVYLIANSKGMAERQHRALTPGARSSSPATSSRSPRPAPARPPSWPRPRSCSTAARSPRASSSALKAKVLA